MHNVEVSRDVLCTLHQQLHLLDPTTAALTNNVFLQALLLMTCGQLRCDATLLLPC
jgi:hypothetical protein